MSVFIVFHQSLFKIYLLLQNLDHFRYLLHIMLEASCLEWALILAVVLRDSLAVVRVVNTASLTDTPLDMVGRMREGLSYLELWADTEWYVLVLRMSIE